MKARTEPPHNLYHLHIMTCTVIYNTAHALQICWQLLLNTIFRKRLQFQFSKTHMDIFKEFCQPFTDFHFFKFSLEIPPIIFTSVTFHLMALITNQLAIQLHPRAGNAAKSASYISHCYMSLNFAQWGFDVASRSLWTFDSLVLCSPSCFNAFVHLHCDW